MRTRDGWPTHSPAARVRAAALLALAVGLQSGCGREFFREWANQDVSEAVFEKSRDPRWRLDMFSIEPPALARFTDPYDPDRPPAPPDDRAAEALAPVPQWPDNRLIIPPEGTGYLDMLEAWQRNRPPAARTNRRTAVGFGPPAAAPSPPAPGTPSPFATPPAPNPPTAPVGPAAPGAAPNSGPDGGAMTPMSSTGARPATPTDRGAVAVAAGPGGGAGAKRPTDPTRAQTRPRDPGVTLAAFQQTGIPLPSTPPAGAGTEGFPPARDIKVPPIGMDPAPDVEQDLSAPVNPRRDQTPEQYRASEAMASELAGILVPRAVEFDEAEAAGLPAESTPYVLTMNQAFTLALINSRVYQFQLENVYLAALSVTLQRFAFTPQLYAGLTPTTGVLGGGLPAPILANSFNYSTRETGQQISNLNIGTMAGFGKLFDSGAKLIAGFANQVVFNFIGKNSFQPTVRSYLPLTLVQPFLRGGGRAVTLEQLTLAERNLLYAVRSFAKFRQEFTVATLVGGSITNFGSSVTSLGFSGGGNNDPTTGFLNVVEDVQLIENDRRNIAAYEQLVTVYKELIQGESSGLSQLQLDQVESGLQGAKQGFIRDRTQYRLDLDSFKMQMGLPPDTPIIPDRSITQPFRDVFDAVDEWQRNPRRDLKDLPSFAEKLPQLEDIVVDGRSVLGVYPMEDKTRGVANTEEGLEDVLLAAERIAMEHRLDLMNQRALLYDAWRAIKVAANALQGVLNVSLTNQFLTPPTTTNPFGFVDQAKQFSLVLNAELPLVRMAERNNFRTALLNYQRQRRALQNFEDSIKLNLRTEIRSLQTTYLNYEILKRNFILTIRQKDQAFEQIIAPPQGAAGAGNTNAALQTTNLVNFQQSLLNIENQLVSTWYQYQSTRLQIYRDLGTLPYDEWEAFHELFPAEPVGDAAAAPSDAGTARAPAPGAAAAVGGAGG